MQATGLLNYRNLCWFNGHRNFGDALSPLLYYAITGRRAIHSRRAFTRRHTMYFSTGSILHIIREPKSAIVWGSGIIMRDAVFPEPQKICAVRGPYTMKRCLQLGYDCPSVFGDPGLLTSRYLTLQGGSKYKVGIVPHYVDYSAVSAVVQPSDRVTVIDVTQEASAVVRHIGECERILSSSLHGIIVAHSYGIPACWVKFSDRLYGDDVKFADYFGAVLPTEDVQPACMELFDERNLLAFVNSSAGFTSPNIERLAARLLDSCPYV